MEKEKNKISRTRWIAGACSAAAMLIVGVGYLNQYREVTDLAEVQNREVLTTETVHEEVVNQPLISSAQMENGNASLMQEQDGMEDESFSVQKETNEEESTEEKVLEQEQTENTKAGNSKKDNIQKDNTKIKDTENRTDTDFSEKVTKDETSAVVAGKTISYTIQKGDTLTSICQERYGTIQRIEEICRLNGISSEDLIFAGQELLLPEQ